MIVVNSIMVELLQTRVQEDTTSGLQQAQGRPGALSLLTDKEGVNHDKIL